MAYVLQPSGGGLDGTVDVDRDSLCYSALPGNGGVLRRVGKALSWDRQFILLRGTVVFEPRQALALCAPIEVYRRVGGAPVLLDLSGSGGGRGAEFCPLSGW